MKNPFRYFNSSPEVIRLTVMLYIRYPLSLRQVEDLLFKRGIDLCHETVRFWWNRFGPMFAAEIRKRRVQNRCNSQWRWHLDEVFVRSMVRRIISGGPLITKEKCSRSLPRNAGIARLH
jgi:putative transposase